MRQDEILSLEWSHVKLFRKTVTAMKSKNGEKRNIALNKRAFDLLKAKEAHTTSGYVFAGETSTKILARNLHRGFDGVKKRDHDKSVTPLDITFLRPIKKAATL